MQTPPPTSRRRALVEIALIFAVFCIQGAWPVPDVNEPYYLGKAIHFWNPDYLRGDFFMESADTHAVFYFTFGWLSLWLPPVALAWTGRILTWLLLAWTWQRLSVAMLPRPWYSVLTAALFACLMDRCEMAGEWVIGGVEAKGFAYVLVFAGLESLLRNRWNRALWMLGAASAFHALVGGWAAVAAGVAWLWLKRSRPMPVGAASATAGGEIGVAGSRVPPLRSLWPGMVGGLLLSLPGLIPVLTLDWGVDRETVRQAHQIYVFDRLPHHLTLTGIKGLFILRMGLLWIFWLVLGRLWPGSAASRRLRAFVGAVVAIAWIGVAVQALVLWDPALAADLLRYYWFRLLDVAVPLGVALEATAFAVWALDAWRPTVRRLLVYALVAVPVVHAAFLLHTKADWVGDRIALLPPRSYGAIGRIGPPATSAEKIEDFDRWYDACRWVRNPQNIPPGARFLTPRLAQTFKWYTRHPSVADWKDVPQDAAAMVEWWRRVQEIYSTGERFPNPRWHESLAELGAERLKQLGQEYHADYVITQRTDPPLELDAVYDNRTYIIYRLR